MDCTIFVAKTKVLISCVVNAQLICEKKLIYSIHIYNATTQNNREIDRVIIYKLYIATVSIKHNSVDRIKTALRFWLNATR